MTRRVVLHVGSPKSGTTYLQQVLRHNAERLAGQGVLVAGRTHVELVHAGLVIREDARLRRLPPRASQAWERVVQQVEEFEGETAVVSYELLAAATERQAAKAIGAFGDREVSVVITTRDLGRAISSAWQERLKFGHGVPLEEWSPRAETAVRAEWGWRTLNPLAVARRWGSGLAPHAVHIVTVGDGADPALLWRRFAAACAIENVSVDLEVPRVNQSLGAAAAELLRRVNAEDLGEISGSREQARWLRDLLAHTVLAPLDDEPMSITPDQHALAVAKADEVVAGVMEEGYQVHGDLEDLRATRRKARTPSEVGDSELLALAVKAMVGLLQQVRLTSLELQNVTRQLDIHRRAAEASVSPVNLRQRGRRRLRALVTRIDDDVVSALQERVDELSRAVESDRRLHPRVAALADLVEELLMPSGDSAEALAARVRDYREDSL